MGSRGAQRRTGSNDLQLRYCDRIAFLLHRGANSRDVCCRGVELEHPSRGFVGEYDARRQDDLRDDSRTNLPIVIRDPATGLYTRAAGFERNVFRADWLFSYQPTPGTVFFAGYGSSLTEPESLRFGRLRRTADGFFMKLSYLLRM